MEIDLNEKLPYEIRFLMRLKANEFKKNGTSDINIKEIQDYLYSMKWKNDESNVLCDVVDDIMSLHLSDVFDFMKLQVIKEASTMKIDDFSDFISK